MGLRSSVVCGRWRENRWWWVAFSPKHWGQVTPQDEITREPCCLLHLRSLQTADYVEGCVGILVHLREEETIVTRSFYNPKGICFMTLSIYAQTRGDPKSSFPHLLLQHKTPRFNGMIEWQYETKHGWRELDFYLKRRYDRCFPTIIVVRPCYKYTVYKLCRSAWSYDSLETR